MIIGKFFSGFLHVLTGIFAIATLILMLVWYINNAVGGILLQGDALSWVLRLKNYLTLATIFCAGIDFTLKRNIVFAIIFACIVVAVALFMVYTDVAIV